MTAEVTTYEKRPVIVLKKDEFERFPFSFGIAKAKLILDHIEEIKKFVEDNQQVKKE